MLFKHLANRQIRSESQNKQQYYLNQLGRLQSFSEETQLLEGNFTQHPELDSVAGTAAKHCEQLSHADKVIISDDDGMISLYDTNSNYKNNVKLLTKFSVHRMTIFDCEWVPTQLKVITASGDRSACIVDLTSQCVIDTYQAHTGSLRCVTARKQDPFVFATGARDGMIAVWDTRVSKKANCMPTANEIRLAHSSGRSRRSVNQSVTGLIFQDEYSLISCASNDSSIKVWDLRKSYKTMKCEPQPKYTFTYHGTSGKNVAYSCLVMDSCRCSLFVNCTDNCIYKFDCLTYKNEVVQKYKGHQNRSFFVKSSLNPDGKLLITGSSDKKAHIYHVDSGSRLAELEGHLEEVTSVSWSPIEIDKLVTLSDDNSMRLWKFSSLASTDAGDGHCTVITRDVDTKKKSKVNENMKTQVPGKLKFTDLPPWPRMSSWEFLPRISSPIKLIISPRKSASQIAAGMKTRASREVTAPIKRNLLDHMTQSSKRPRLDICTTLSPRRGDQTLSPIRINNHSIGVYNVTPRTRKRLALEDESCSSSSTGQTTPGKENSDWLTKYSKDRIYRMSKTPETPKSVKNTNKLRSGNKTPTTIKNCSPSTTLFRYFSPSSKDSNLITDNNNS